MQYVGILEGELGMTRPFDVGYNNLTVVEEYQQVRDAMNETKNKTKAPPL
jgi:hypothetical protein